MAFVVLVIILVFIVLIIVFVILNKRSEDPQKYHYNSELADRTAGSDSPESKVVDESTEFTSEKEREAFS